jgi:hypothetical protein
MSTMCDAAPAEVLLQRSSAVTARTLDGETLLYNETNHQVLVLDPVATEVWDAIGTSTSLSELCTTLSARFATQTSIVARDLREPLERLISSRMLLATPQEDQPLAHQTAPQPS